MDYETKRCLQNAIYIINHMQIAFKQAEEHLTRTFTRVKEDEAKDMVKLFLPAYIKKDAEKFMKESEKILK